MAGIAVLFTSACNKVQEEITPEENLRENGPVYITANIDQETKATLHNTSGAFAFSSGDAIMVCNESGDFSGTTTSTENSGTFVMADGFDGSTDGYAGFPASLVSNITSSSVTFTLPSSYAFSEIGSDDPNNCKVPCPMIGQYVASTKKVILKQAGALICFRITNTVEGSLSFTFTDATSSSVTGRCMLTSIPFSTNDGILALEDAGSTVTITGVPALSDGTYRYITIPVPTGTKPHEILVTNTPSDPAIASRISAYAGVDSGINRAQGYRATARPVPVLTTPTFKIGAETTAVLAPGNLMACIATINTETGVATASSWKFGGPYEIVGDGTSDGNYLFAINSASCVGKWVDLLSWQGASVETKAHGLIQVDGPSDALTGNSGSEDVYDGCWNTYTNNAAHDGYFQISNGGDYTWRPMTSTEMIYLMNKRTGAVVAGNSGCRFANATVAGIHGQLLFPDSDVDIWDAGTMGTAPQSASGVAAFNQGTETPAVYEMNTYTASNMLAMQNVGIIFLPCGGYRSDNLPGGIVGSNVKMNYWTSSGGTGDKKLAYTKTSNIQGNYKGHRGVGRLIRLIRVVDPS